MKGDENAEIGVVWGLGVTQGNRKYSHLIECIMTSYSTLIEIRAFSSYSELLGPFRLAVPSVTRCRCRIHRKLPAL